MRIPLERLQTTFERILLAHGVSAENAAVAAANYAQNSLDGVYSHGVNRFPRTIEYLDRGLIDGAARPVVTAAFGAVERWDGRMGLGNVNARLAMDRAVALAHRHGVGLVALGNTNHWMRGGAFGWQAADAGCIGICWTNTIPNAPVWGARDNRIGNNPLVIAIPRSDGRHVVLDTAMTQYSYGKIDQIALQGGQLPVPGGYDAAGSLTTDAKAIQATRRPLTIGYWKGSGLSIVLDLAAALLSGGNTVTDIGQKYTDEIGLSQVFIAADPAVLQSPAVSDAAIERVAADLHASVPAKAGEAPRCPGEGTLAARAANLANGIPVEETVWQEILAL